MICGGELRAIDYCNNSTIREKEGRAGQPHYTRVCDECKTQYTATVRADGEYRGQHVELLTVRIAANI
jgi:hypothetical protein